MRLYLTVSALAFLSAACSSPPPVIPTKNLEHPSDMTFVCLASDGTTLSGQSMDKCHPRGAPDPTVTLSGKRNLGTFAFVTSPGRNELAIGDMELGRLLDLRPEAPGYGMLPVGGNPEAIASSPDGCWVVTANRTSCDFTLVDPSRLLAATFSTSSSQVVPATGAGDADASRRVVVRTHSGTVLRSSTGEIAFLPQAAPAPDVPALCQAEAKRTAVATFPSCDMVALLEFSFADSTATIISAFYIRPNGFLAAGGDPVCPADCGAPSDTTGLDAGVESVDGGGASGSGLDGGVGGGNLQGYLEALALVPDGTRVYVGGLLDTAITSLDIGASELSNPARINLAGDPIGVTRLRLGIDPYLSETVTRADGSTVITQGKFLQNRGKFLYAITRDDSIRVVEIAAPPGVNQATPVECDANIIITDPSVTEPAKGCFPVGSTPRRSLAQGPGIRIPHDIRAPNPDNPPPLPRDISFADLQPSATDTNYQSLSGQFGFVIASNGQVYVLNLAPNGEDGSSSAPDRTKTMPITATHSFRDARDVGKWARTPLALSIAPQRTVITSDQAFPTTATYSAVDGPLIRSFPAADGTTNWLDYPDPDTMISRVWSIVWEGALPYASRASGVVKSDALSAGVLEDPGADFCRSDAQPGDVLMFSGCTQNSDCQPDDQFTCQVAVSGARGMCLPIDAATSAKLVEKCGRFMGSRMRYEIAQATPTKLTLQLKLDEVPKTALNPCTKATEAIDCQAADVDHGKLASVPPDGGLIHAFECVELHPLDPTNKDPRCVKRCRVDSDCRAGHFCELVPWTDASVGGLCVEAPPLDPTCFPQPMTSYSVRAGHTFMVYGSSMPTISSVRAGALPTQACQPLAPTDPSLVARIPLSAKKCPDGFGDSLGSTVFVQNLPAQAGYNPCLYQGAHYHDGSAPGTGDGGSPDDQHIRAFFQNPQIRFVLTNLEQYAGDLLSIHFELQYGFLPLTVSIPSYEVLLTVGTRIVTGPLQTPESPIKRDLTQRSSFPYLYVVDQGRTALTPGSRGQVLRINPRAGGSEIASFDTTLSGSTPFQLQ
ncbi:MAG TPA: hypothetical protein VF550_14640 [Polyangia bacterium]